MQRDHWIGGKAQPPSIGSHLSTVNPATGRGGDQVGAGSAFDVEGAVRVACDAQPAWASLSAAERSSVVQRVADGIELHRDELSEAERACTGKVNAQLSLEVDMSAAHFRYYARVVRAVGGRVIDQGADTLTYTQLEPFGVVAVITPWDLPLNQACRALAPALASGRRGSRLAGYTHTKTVSVSLR